MTTTEAPGRRIALVVRMRLLDGVGLQDFVAVMVDDLDGDRASGGWVERTAARAVEGRPCLLVDLRVERLPQTLVGVVRAGEVGVTNEETLGVVVRVDEPAGDGVGVVGPDLTGSRVIDVYSADLDLDPSVRVRSIWTSGSPNTVNRFPRRSV